MTVCEFCAASLPPGSAENVTLLRHLAGSERCRGQFEHLLENIRSSWTRGMSGGS